MEVVMLGVVMSVGGVGLLVRTNQISRTNLIVRTNPKQVQPMHLQRMCCGLVTHLMHHLMRLMH